jgi:prepilin-type N-terminal cleavage/methylation domain-containing protein
MTFKRRGGFTLIELMVSLVVGGLLMATLVAFSGAVRKSFARSKDVSELQANLRFAMKVLVDDLSRVSYRISPYPEKDESHICMNCNVPLASWHMGPAIGVSAAADGTMQLNLIGNYLGSREYVFNLFSGELACNNQDFIDQSKPIGQWCPYPGSENAITQRTNFNNPFMDGPSFGSAFIPDNIVFIKDLKSERGSYHRLSNVSVNTLAIELDPAIDHQYLQGNFGRVTPIGKVDYQLRARPDGVWVLERLWTDVAQNNTMEVAEFLLPYDDTDAPGLEIRAVWDQSDQFNEEFWKSGGYWEPVLDFGDNLNQLQVFPQADELAPGQLMRMRALIVTIRGRMPTEDPGFVLGNYAAEPEVAKNFGYDLDGDPSNGLARVRVERTMIDLRNISLGQHGTI